MTDNTLATKADLAALVLRIIRRTDATPIENETDNIIRLAEAGLNRRLPAVETDTTLAGIISSRRIDITSIRLVEPVALFITISGEEKTLRPDPDGTVEYSSTNGEPISWALDGTGSYIDFNRPCDQAYAFRFRNVQRFALAADGDTNWLLTNHPDVYVAACVVWGYARMEDVPNAAQWSQQLDSGVLEVKQQLANFKKRAMTVDPSIQMIGRYYGGRSGFNVFTGE